MAGAAVGAVVLAGAGVGGCSSDGSDRSTAEPPPSAADGSSTGGGGAPSGGAPSAEPGRSPVQLPASPPLDDPEALAGLLSRAVSLTRDPDASARELRSAGQLEQRAARGLARGPEATRRAVLARLSGAARQRTRAHVEAAGLLDAMTTPQPRLPDWRIVKPPPAAELLRHYRYAARRVGVPWQHLAAIHLVETRMGRIRGVSSAGALGPMQFLPTTWELYGEGGDIQDPRDAIVAAARLLRANGAPGDMAGAVWHYNPSDNYVGAVMRYAEQLRRSPESYRGYWHWQVLYAHQRGTYVLDHGYPQVRPERLS